MSTIASKHRGRGPVRKSAAASPDSLDRRLADRIAFERRQRQWSAAELAERSGVSRAMVAKIEAGAVRPTASLLGRLTAAFSLPLSTLFERIEQDDRTPLARSADQVVWRDPETGYRRRALSPGRADPLQLTEVRLPAGARVPYPAEAYAYLHTQVWVLGGTLHFHEGTALHTLSKGDCLAIRDAVPCTFANNTGQECRYLVAVTRR